MSLCPKPGIAVSRLKRGSLIPRDCSASAMRLPRGAKYQIARHLTRAASPGKIPLHGEAQRLRSVRRGGDRRADSHGAKPRRPTRDRRYAATAVRPCARATFAGALSRARISAGLPIAVNAMRNLKRGVSGHEIRKRAAAPGRSRAQAGPVLVIGPDAALRVRGGALDVEHGSGTGSRSRQDRRR